MVLLSPEQEWTLVACGLVAHADGVIEVGEWDRILVLLDETLGGAEQDPWRKLLADHEALCARLEALQPPAPLFCEGILGRAWRMALADGQGSEREVAVLDTVARKLGVPITEVVALRAVGLRQAEARAEIVAGFAVVVATIDGKLDPEEVEEYEALLGRLPLGQGRYEALRALLDTPPDLDSLVGQMLALSSDERGVVLQSLAPLVRAGSGEGAERALFVAVAERLAVSPADAEAMLAR